jgi:hypothetical protein
VGEEPPEEMRKEGGKVLRNDRRRVANEYQNGRGSPKLVEGRYGRGAGTDGSEELWKRFLIRERIATRTVTPYHSLQRIGIRLSVQT